MSTQARFDVARAFSKLTATPEGRNYLAQNGYTSGRPVICVEYNDLIGDVLRRAAQYRGDKVVVAMINRDELEAVTFTPTAKSEESSEVSRYSCIGMLFDALGQSGRRETFRLTDTLITPRVTFAQPLNVAIPA